MPFTHTTCPLKSILSGMEVPESRTSGPYCSSSWVEVMTGLMGITATLNQASSLPPQCPSSPKLDIYWIELVLKLCAFFLEG